MFIPFTLLFLTLHRQKRMLVERNVDETRSKELYITTLEVWLCAHSISAALPIYSLLTLMLLTLQFADWVDNSFMQVCWVYLKRMKISPESPDAEAKLQDLVRHQIDIATQLSD